MNSTCGYRDFWEFDCRGVFFIAYLQPSTLCTAWNTVPKSPLPISSIEDENKQMSRKQEKILSRQRNPWFAVDQSSNLKLW